MCVFPGIFLENEVAARKMFKNFTNCSRVVAFRAVQQLCLFV